MVRLVFRPYAQVYERFARQYRYELPPGFPLASLNSGIGHHLSGLNKYAQARTSRVGRCCIGISQLSLSLRVEV